MKVIKFAYYDEFCCIGAECSDSCCKHWSITLSKREYLDYKKMKCSPKLKSMIDSAFTRIDNKKATDSVYAFMKLRENGDCPFLDDDCLCSIQKEMGEKALSMVCTTFPRLQANVGNDALIFACDITCPHVVEILMEHPEGLELVEQEYDNSIASVNKGIFSMRGTPNDWEGYPYYWIIKGAQIDILQNRSFTVPERMLILGFFCQKAEDYIKSGQGGKIQTLYDMLLDNDMCKKVADSLKASQSNESIAAKSIDILVKVILKTKQISNTVTYRHFQDVAANIGLTIDTTKEKGYTFIYDTERYISNVELYRKIMFDYPHVIENILVNLVFTQAPNEGIWLNYFSLAVFYNILKICVPAFLKEGWTDKDLSSAIAYAAKGILNTRVAKKGISADFMDHNSFDLPHAVFLIS